MTTQRTLPTGTVTFLFSDMEGSTRLVRDLGPARFTSLLERHNAVLREAFRRHGAVERGTQGDSFLVMFAEAPAAVAAAVDAQRALAAEPWPEDATVRVRMGLHTGVGRLGGDDYVGLDVNRAARVAGLGHGGQVLLSDATRALTEGQLPGGVTVRPLGPHRLRDFDRPEPLHQLVVDGLRADFPPVRASERPQGNLPTRLSGFVGREDDLTTLEALLDEAPLLTLTGPGGTGKTRLAIELAGRVADRFADGAWLVRLETIDDPELVPAAIAATFGLIESPGTTPHGRLTTFLADRSLLLVLDNFEQVLPAADVVSELLQASPGVRIVVTSRAPLRLALEQDYPVGPLGVPGEGEDVAGSDAVRLFIARARRAVPGWTPAGDEAIAVAEICRRLDGLPLGIELAASRVRLLPARTIAERLAAGLDLPGPRPRDLPARQQTLAGAIDWSHALLDEPARRLLERVSVFAGGFRLAEAEQVGGPPSEIGAEVIDALSTLVDFSLVEPAPGPDIPRFRLLETIRMFGAERLAASSDAERIRERHARAYLALFEDAATHMPGRGQVPWLDRMTVEHKNARAALAWAIATGSTEIAHRLAAASWRFWQFRGHLTEGRARIAEVLAMSTDDEASAWRMRAVEAAGGLEWWSGNLPGADAYYDRQVAIARALDDRTGLADGLFNLTHTRFALDLEHPEAVVAMREEALRLYRELGDELAAARLEWTEAYPLMMQGRYAEARAAVELALEVFERHDDLFYMSLVAGALSALTLMQGDTRASAESMLVNARSGLEMADVASTTLALRSIALLLCFTGDPEGGATVLAAFEANGQRYGVQAPLNPEGWLQLNIDVDTMFAMMAAPEYAAARERGAAMSCAEAVEFFAANAPTG